MKHDHNKSGSRDASKFITNLKLFSDYLIKKLLINNTGKSEQGLTWNEISYKWRLFFFDKLKSQEPSKVLHNNNNMKRSYTLVKSSSRQFTKSTDFQNQGSSLIMRLRRMVAMQLKKKLFYKEKDFLCRVYLISTSFTLEWII